MIANKIVIVEYDLPREDDMPLSQRRRLAVDNRYSRPLKIYVISSSKSKWKWRLQIRIQYNCDTESRGDALQCRLFQSLVGIDDRGRGEVGVWELEV